MRFFLLTNSRTIRILCDFAHVQYMLNDVDMPTFVCADVVPDLSKLFLDIYCFMDRQLFLTHPLVHEKTKNFMKRRAPH